MLALAIASLFKLTTKKIDKDIQTKSQGDMATC